MDVGTRTDLLTMMPTNVGTDGFKALPAMMIPVVSDDFLVDCYLTLNAALKKIVNILWIFAAFYRGTCPAFFHFIRDQTSMYPHEVDQHTLTNIHCHCTWASLRMVMTSSHALATWCPACDTLVK